LIGPDGEQVGIIPTREALERAREAGLDLVEVSPNSRPPVCRILDYGKYKYNQAKKAATSRKKQHTVCIKGMRFRPKIEEHDYQFKKKHVQNFLEQGNKVKCFVLFRGREKAHTEFGRKILERLASDLEDIAAVENSPKMEGHSMTMLLMPQPNIGIKQPPSVGKKSDKSGSKPDKSEPVPADDNVEG
jgi:translation initiation factor IF-3